jgi:hypothetical protein
LPQHITPQNVRGTKATRHRIWLSIVRAKHFGVKIVFKSILLPKGWQKPRFDGHTLVSRSTRNLGFR